MGLFQSKPTDGVTLDQVAVTLNQVAALLDDTNKKVEAGFGTTYAPLGEIWQHTHDEFGGSAEALRTLRESDTEVLAIYNEANGKNMRDRRLEREKFPPLNMFPGSTGKTSFAHIVPNDPVCALTWGEAVALITGKKKENMLESEELRDFVRGSTEAKNPFKMWYWNYLQLPDDHAEYFDDLKKGKEVIITPIWNPEDEWKPGTRYKLLVASTEEGYKWLMGVRPMKENAPQQSWLGVASDAEYLKSTDFLQMTVKALAESLDNSELIQLVAETMENEDKKENKKQKKNESFDDSEPIKGGAETVEEGKQNNESLDDSEPIKGGAKTVEEGKKKTKQRRQGKFPILNTLKEKYGDIEEMIGQAYFDESASKASNRSNSSQHLSAGLAAKLQTLANTKKAMQKIGNKMKVESSMVHTPGEVESIPAMVYTPGEVECIPANVMTIDLGEYFRGNEEMIPDPYWLALKAAVNYSKYRSTSLLSACDGSKVAKEEVASLPDEITVEFCSDQDDSDAMSVLSESELFTGAPGDYDDAMTGTDEVSIIMTPKKKPLAEKLRIVTP